MAQHDSAADREAKHGQKMIEVKLRFWTNNIAKGKGKVRPKHAWSSGVVRLEGNDAHGIKAGRPIPFNSLLDIPFAIEKALIAHDIQLHIDRRMKKYLSV